MTGSQISSNGIFKRKGKEIVVVEDMYFNEKINMVEHNFESIEINMAFDDLEINMVVHNFDSIVDKLIDDIDHLDEEQYLEKYKTNDLGLHRLSDEEMKHLILKIGLEHILGEKEYNNMVIEGRTRAYFRKRII